MGHDGQHESLIRTTYTESLKSNVLGYKFMYQRPLNAFYDFTAM